MNISEVKTILHNGLWKQNTGVVQLLGLCPLLAISNTVVNAVSLGLATTLVMVVSGSAIAPIRNYVPNEIRIPVYVLIISVLVTVVQYLMNAYMYPLYIVLGIFIPLIVTNCIVLARAEAFASKNALLPSALDGFAMGIGLTAVLGILGGMREIVGHGTLFAGFDLALGEMAKGWVITIIPDYHGFLLAVLPPGAFIGLGLLIAGKNYLTLRAEKKSKIIKITSTQTSAA
ncbi:MAG: electron transport complex subunit RsxE [Gallionellales bacterium 35-53-114]|jgi:electron transport complex protein RnfE|nr:MAG: electron transport complex subunit RsxE [Gallionellales bacterium 35-53-114]OYZ62298.1 MAG: electron transport complex subunit RsxE [Gallionellales bacterium 24-53-125]OZB10581.1 MAG: electron transport complex subunit RsxE [Gallionellales bacterium 39-52-133]HQS57212.1 electron transport complex subunit E [Gallionellaceae bacterium]HQS74600.1 electron transport complex subunit E [Gallionellaceae bacterium]